MLMLLSVQDSQVWMKDLQEAIDYILLMSHKVVTIKISTGESHQQYYYLN